MNQQQIEQKAKEYAATVPANDGPSSAHAAYLQCYLDNFASPPSDPAAGVKCYRVVKVKGGEPFPLENGHYTYSVTDGGRITTKAMVKGSSWPKDRFVHIPESAPSEPATAGRDGEQLKAFIEKICTTWTDFEEDYNAMAEDIRKHFPGTQPAVTREEIEQAATDYSEAYYFPHGMSMQALRLAFLAGNALPQPLTAQQGTGYSEEQVREAIRLAQMENQEEGGHNDTIPLYTPDQIIASLNSPPPGK